MHSYLACSDCDAVSVTGNFAGATFIDKVDEGKEKVEVRSQPHLPCCTSTYRKESNAIYRFWLGLPSQERSVITLGGQFYDRLYKGVTGSFLLVDAGKPNVELCHNVGWCDTVIWNPRECTFHALLRMRSFPGRFPRRLGPYNEGLNRSFPGRFSLSDDGLPFLVADGSDDMGHKTFICVEAVRASIPVRSFEYRIQRFLKIENRSVLMKNPSFLMQNPSILVRRTPCGCDLWGYS